jgi:hypothetical protein
MLMLDGVRQRAAIEADLHEYIREAVESRLDEMLDETEGPHGASVCAAAVEPERPDECEQAIADRVSAFVDGAIRRILAGAHGRSVPRVPFTGTLGSASTVSLRLALFETMCAWQLASAPPHKHTAHAVLFASFVLAPVAELFELPPTMMALSELHVLLRLYRSSCAAELLEYSLHVLSSARRPAAASPDSDADVLSCCGEYARLVLSEADGLMRERLAAYAAHFASEPDLALALQLFVAARLALHMLQPQQRREGLATPAPRPAPTAAAPTGLGGALRSTDGAGADVVCDSAEIQVRCHICAGTGLAPATSALGLHASSCRTIPVARSRAARPWNALRRRGAESSIVALRSHAERTADRTRSTGMTRRDDVVRHVAWSAFAEVKCARCGRCAGRALCDDTRRCRRRIRWYALVRDNGETVQARCSARNMQRRAPMSAQTRYANAHARVRLLRADRHSDAAARRAKCIRIRPSQRRPLARRACCSPLPLPFASPRHTSTHERAIRRVDQSGATT